MVEPDTTVVVVVGVTGLVVVGAALVAVGAAGLVVLVGAVLEAPPEQAETHMARTAKETAVRLMVGVSHECRSDPHWRPLSSTWLVELGESKHRNLSRVSVWTAGACGFNDVCLTDTPVSVWWCAFCATKCATRRAGQSRHG